MSPPIAIDLRLREILARDVAHAGLSLITITGRLNTMAGMLWNNRVSRLEDATPGANAWDWGWL
jgi:hypothetical protein